MKQIKTIRSHAGLARFLAECETEDPIGEIARIPEIPSPYRYSSAHNVERYKGKNVFWVETSHKVYKVFEVPADATIHPLGTL